jgi:nitrate/nitrite transporter NarK
LLQVNGVAGLKGWQWMFLIEALPALVLTPIILRVLSDKPAEAAWLSIAEQEWLKKRLDREVRQPSAAQRHKLSDVLRSSKVIYLGVAYFGVTGFNYALSFFLPQIVQQFGLSVVQTGLVSAIPFAVAAIGMTWWGRRSDRLCEYRRHLLIPLALAIMSLAGSTFVGPPVLKLALLSVAAFGLFAALPIYWTVPPAVLAPANAAAGIALINAVGNLSGFVNPYAIGALRDLTGSFSGGLRLISGFGMIAWVILAWVTRGSVGASTRDRVATR